MRYASLILLTALFAAFLWLAAEVSVFLYVVDQVGFVGTIVLALATSYLGILLLRRVGEAARQSLFGLMRRSEGGFFLLQGGLRNGALGALGAVLLILPGFLSDAFGCILALASSSFWLAPPSQDRQHDPDVVDLSPQDWRHLDSAGRLPKRR
jgi:UPF0716 protein FxsA